jgi:YaiO family outer membrane protein
MRAARYAIIAGAVGLQSLSALAGEGSSLRGLKVPASALDAEAVAPRFSGGAPRLKRNGDTALPQVVPPRLFLSGGTSQAHRVTAKDTEYRLGVHQPAGQNIPALAESNIHTLVDALPRYTLYSDVTRALPGGWGLGFGVRETEYSFSTRNLLSFSAHRDFGSFRGAYTLYSNGAEGSGLGSAHRFEVRYLYGERNTIGLSYTTGRDIDNAGLPMAFSSGDVRDWTLSGRHWLSPNWALTYDVLSQDQGSFYRRQGLRLGVSRSF